MTDAPQSSDIKLTLKQEMQHMLDIIGADYFRRTIAHLPPAEQKALLERIMTHMATPLPDEHTKQADGNWDHDALEQLLSSVFPELCDYVLRTQRKLDIIAPKKRAWWKRLLQ